MGPKLYNTPNVLHSPAEQFVNKGPVPPPTSLATANTAQKQMRASGIQTTKAAYLCGADEARTALGITKRAGRLNPLRSWFQRILEGPQGHTALKVPIQAALGGGAGAIAGEIHSGDPLAGAALGATSVGLRGLAVEQVPRMRQALLRSLKGR